MGRLGIRSFKTRVGWECSINRRRARLYSGGVRGESHSVTSGDTTGGQLPRVRAIKSSEFGEGKAPSQKTQHMALARNRAIKQSYFQYRLFSSRFQH